jgi:hypothetical protein
MPGTSNLQQPIGPKCQLHSGLPFGSFFQQQSKKRRGPRSPRYYQSAALLIVVAELAIHGRASRGRSKAIAKNTVTLGNRTRQAAAADGRAPHPV